MARELRAIYNGSATLYAVIFRVADDYVWNGTTWEAYVNGNVATYDVALTARGGDVYNADMPSGIAAGDYYYVIYQQAGGSPATTDEVVKTSARFHWDGTAASSGSSVTIATYALATLNGLKRHLRITDSDSDTLLTETINSSSALIERVGGKLWLSRDLRHRLDGDWQRTVVLPQKPVNTINAVRYGAAGALSVTYTGSAIRAQAAVTQTGIRLHTVSSSGTATASHLLFADYGSCTSLETAIEAVSGWTATVLNNVPSTDLNPTGGQDALNRTVEFDYPDRDDVEWVANYDRGTVEFNRFGAWRWQEYRDNWYAPRRVPRQSQGIIVEYNAGYSAVPADVEQLCREIATEMYYAGYDNPAIKSSTLGPYSVTFGGDDYAIIIRQRLAHLIDADGYIA